MMTLTSLLLQLFILIGPFAAGATVIVNEQHPLPKIGNSIWNTQDDVQKALQDAEIIPTVIDDFLPSLLMNATWSSHHHTHADLGNTLEPSLLESAPSVKLMASKPTLWKKGVTYVITMTDPDAPSRDDPKWSEFCHWIAIGVPTSSGISPTFSDEIMRYKPPSPPEKTGKHRYVLLAFAPANGTTEKLHLSRPNARKHWGYEVGDDGDKDTKGVREWAAENGLVPVGANFFYAQNKKH
ncbi:carboxypeptidase Y inhibitor [Podospora bellae-mahoneyi]|uniref:Carboxypeptidase Y inhibitor n=1 Tax=Podospora bellae-mahoneyi TaxID=2093777 RepID=A0ABR0FIY9_9PEZI|nr:carboxypeptidase Y inhibitor [Podospora bellae-mahoneyi]